MSRKDGIGGVVRQAVSQPLPAAADTQAELFNLPLVQRHGETEASFIARRDRALDEARRGRGRPKGAQSVSTTQWRDFALRHGPHPVVAMMRWLDLGPHGLAAELQIPLKDAFDRWAGLAKELAPYFMARQAPVDDQGKAVPGLAMFVGNTGVNTESSGLPPWMAAFRTSDGEVIDVPVMAPSDGDDQDALSPSGLHEGGEDQDALSPSGLHEGDA
jgi:hypothetical protein